MKYYFSKTTGGIAFSSDGAVCCPLFGFLVLSHANTTWRYQFAVPAGMKLLLILLYYYIHIILTDSEKNRKHHLCSVHF